jgi:pimeloyl-ACP methyl ester carboxylesterase
LLQNMPLLHLQDIHVYYETHGQGEPVLFIHGLGSSARDWERQIDAFASRYRVILYDLRGHGRSDHPSGPYSMAQLADDAALLLDALAAAPAHVIGLSLGGMIAYQLAVSGPDCLRSLTVTSSAPEVVARSPRQRLALGLRLWMIHALPIALLNRVLAWYMFPERGQAGLRRLLIERWAGNDRRSNMAALKAVVGWSVADRLGAIRCPMLIVVGQRDRGPLDTRGSYVARIPDVHVLEIPGARHAVPVDQPQRFNTAVLEFLDRISAQGH